MEECLFHYCLRLLYRLIRLVAKHEMTNVITEQLLEAESQPKICLLAYVQSKQPATPFQTHYCSPFYAHNDKSIMKLLTGDIQLIFLEFVQLINFHIPLTQRYVIIAHTTQHV